MELGLAGRCGCVWLQRVAAACGGAHRGSTAHDMHGVRAWNASLDRPAAHARTHGLKPMHACMHPSCMHAHAWRRRWCLTFLLSDLHGVWRTCSRIDRCEASPTWPTQQAPIHPIAPLTQHSRRTTASACAPRHWRQALWEAENMRSIMRICAKDVRAVGRVVGGPVQGWGHASNLKNEFSESVPPLVAAWHGPRAKRMPPTPAKTR